MLFKDVENVHKKSTFYSSYKKFWVKENYFQIIEKLDIIMTRKGLKVFSTLHTTVPHNLLIKVISEIIHFVFNRKFVVNYNDSLRKKIVSRQLRS